MDRTSIPSIPLKAPAIDSINPILLDELQERIEGFILPSIDELKAGLIDTIDQDQLFFYKTTQLAEIDHPKARLTILHLARRVPKMPEALVEMRTSSAYTNIYLAYLYTSHYPAFISYIENIEASDTSLLVKVLKLSRIAIEYKKRNDTNLLSSNKDLAVQVLKELNSKFPEYQPAWFHNFVFNAINHCSEKPRAEYESLLATVEHRQDALVNFYLHFLDPTLERELFKEMLFSLQKTIYVPHILHLINSTSERIAKLKTGKNDFRILKWHQELNEIIDGVHDIDQNVLTPLKNELRRVTKIIKHRTQEITHHLKHIEADKLKIYLNNPLLSKQQNQLLDLYFNTRATMRYSEEYRTSIMSALAEIPCIVPKLLEDSYKYMGEIKELDVPLIRSTIHNYTLVRAINNLILEYSNDEQKLIPILKEKPQEQILTFIKKQINASKIAPIERYVEFLKLIENRQDVFAILKSIRNVNDRLKLAISLDVDRQYILTNFQQIEREVAAINNEHIAHISVIVFHKQDQFLKFFQRAVAVSDNKDAPSRTASILTELIASHCDVENFMTVNDFLNHKILRHSELTANLWSVFIEHLETAQLFAPTSDRESYYINPLLKQEYSVYQSVVDQYAAIACIGRYLFVDGAIYDRHHYITLINRIEIVPELRAFSYMVRLIACGEQIVSILAHLDVELLDELSMAMSYSKQVVLGSILLAVTSVNSYLHNEIEYKQDVLDFLEEHGSNRYLTEVMSLQDFDGKIQHAIYDHLTVILVELVPDAHNVFSKNDISIGRALSKPYIAYFMHLAKLMKISNKGIKSANSSGTDNFAATLSRLVRLFRGCQSSKELESIGKKHGGSIELLYIEALLHLIDRMRDNERKLASVKDLDVYMYVLNEKEFIQLVNHYSDHFVKLTSRCANSGDAIMKEEAYTALSSYIGRIGSVRNDSWKKQELQRLSEKYNTLFDTLTEHCQAYAEKMSCLSLGKNKEVSHRGSSSTSNRQQQGNRSKKSRGKQEASKNRR
jgi:hypothetical protein